MAYDSMYYLPSAMDYWTSGSGSRSSSSNSFYQMKQLAQQEATAAKDLAYYNNSFNASEAAKQRSFEQALFNSGNQFNASEAAKNRNWQEAMSNSAHQREIKDLQAAGLNPILSASGGNGASVTAGATASSLGAPSGAHATADTSANAAIAQIYGSMMNYMAQTDAMKTSAESAQRIAAIQAETQRYVADQSASASRYGSSASILNSALQAATSRAINSAQLAKQQELAEYDFQKQMQYRAYDRETQQKNLESQLYNQEYMALNYPGNMYQAAAAAGHNYFKAGNNFLTKLLTSVKGIFSKKSNYGKF